MWRTATVSDDELDVPAPPRGLRGNAVLSGLTALACLVAAGAELWRYTLMLRGRTWVLSGAQVRADDALLAWSAGLALLLATVTAGWAIPNLIALHRGSAVRNGAAPSRTGAAIASRLVVPGWNVYGAGQILAEIDGELAVLDGAAPAGPDRRRRQPPPESEVPRPSALIVVWWGCWGLNAVLVVITLVSAFWRSLQAMANTVEWHIAVDLAATAVAALFAVVLVRFERRWSGRARSDLDGWTVALPVSDPTNRRSRLFEPVVSSESAVAEPVAPSGEGAESAGSAGSEPQLQDGTSDRLQSGESEERADAEEHGVDHAGARVD